jgi:hypothetical protein
VGSARPLLPAVLQKSAGARTASPSQRATAAGAPPIGSGSERRGGITLAQRGPQRAQQAPVPHDSTTGAVVSARNAALSLPPRMSTRVATGGVAAPAAKQQLRRDYCNRRSPAAHPPSSDTCSAFVRSISVATPTSLLRADCRGAGAFRLDPRRALPERVVLLANCKTSSARPALACSEAETRMSVFRSRRQLRKRF